MNLKHRQRQVVLLRLLQALKDNNSWCGETHIQKSAYFLEKLFKVPLDLNFTLYMHGPFSFDLRDELTVMRSDLLVEIQILRPTFGPSWVVSETGSRLAQRWPRTTEMFSSAIDFVASRLGPCGVVELERLATALYVTVEEQLETPDARARRIHELKPHVALEQATQAVISVEAMLAQQRVLPSGARPE